MFFKNLLWSLQNMQEMTGEMQFAWGFGVGFLEKNILSNLEYDVLEGVHT